MSTRIVRFLFGATLALMIAVALIRLPTPADSAPTTRLPFTVNSPADVADANPGNGVCETANGAKGNNFHRPVFGGSALRCDIGAVEYYSIALTLPLIVK